MGIIIITNKIQINMIQMMMKMEMIMGRERKRNLDSKLSKPFLTINLMDIISSKNLKIKRKRSYDIYYLY